jgi:hypothetical protein
MTSIFSSYSKTKFKEELQILLPKISEKIIDHIVSKYDGMEDLCWADHSLLSASLMGVGASKSDSIYKKLTPKRRELGLDCEGLFSALYTKWNDEIDEKKLKELLSLIRNAGDKRAEFILSKLIEHVAHEAKDEGYENGRDAGYRDGYWEGEHDSELNSSMY